MLTEHQFLERKLFLKQQAKILIERDIEDLEYQILQLRQEQFRPAFGKEKRHLIGELEGSL